MTGRADYRAGYISLQDADAWFAARGLTEWAAATRDQRAAALLRAADWLDGYFRFRGQPAGH